LRCITRRDTVVNQGPVRLEAGVKVTTGMSEIAKFMAAERETAFGDRLVSSGTHIVADRRPETERQDIPV
jgi:hypothetical protein